MLCLITTLIRKRFKNRDYGPQVFYCYDHVRILPKDGLWIESYGKTCYLKNTGIVCAVPDNHTLLGPDIVELCQFLEHLCFGITLCDRADNLSQEIAIFHKQFVRNNKNDTKRFTYPLGGYGKPTGNHSSLITPTFDIQDKFCCSRH